MRMLGHIRDGGINCIVVKDFSRFSRDYIELGSYLEQVFPFLGVRFISLNDHYDSAGHIGNVAGLEASFKGLMYDLYSKDLSLKVKSSLYIRKEQGQYASANTPFGYVKDPEDRHRLVIEQDEAEVVKKIFSLALAGQASPAIAKLLNEEGIKTPMEFKMEKKQSMRRPLGSRFHWNASVICSILKNPVYVGDMVYGKYSKDEVGGKPHLNPRSEWKIFKNHHTAVVSREDFDMLQKQRSHTGHKKTKINGISHPLQGKVFCAGCGRRMALNKNRLNPYFYCKKEYGDTGKDCIGKVNLMFLEQAVLDQINGRLSNPNYRQALKLEQEAAIQEKLSILQKERSRLLNRRACWIRNRLEEYEKTALGSGNPCKGNNANIYQLEEMLGGIESEISKLKEKLFCQENRPGEQPASPSVGMAITKELAEKLISKIVIDRKGHLGVEWKAEPG